MNTTLKQTFAVSGLLFNSIIWGLTFIMVKWSVAELEVCYFLFLRFFSAFILTAILFGKHIKRPGWKTVKSSLILGSLLTISFLVQTEGLRYTTATNVAMISGLYLIMIPILSATVFKDRIRSASIFGAVISVCGLYLLTQYSFTGINLGDYLTLICAFGWAWHIILTGRFTQRHNAMPLVIYQFLFVSIFMGITAFIKGSFTLEIPPIAWLTVAVTAIFATAVAILIQTYAQKIIDPTRVGIIFALEAVFGALFAWRLGGEILTTISLIGAVLITAGMITSESVPIAKYILNKIVG